MRERASIKSNFLIITVLMIAVAMILIYTMSSKVLENSMKIEFDEKLIRAKKYVAKSLKSSEESVTAKNRLLVKDINIIRHMVKKKFDSVANEDLYKKYFDYGEIEEFKYEFEIHKKELEEMLDVEDLSNIKLDIYTNRWQTIFEKPQDYALDRYGVNRALGKTDELQSNLREYKLDEVRGLSFRDYQLIENWNKKKLGVSVVKFYFNREYLKSLSSVIGADLFIVNVDGEIIESSRDSFDKGITMGDEIVIERDRYTLVYLDEILDINREKIVSIAIGKNISEMQRNVRTMVDYIFVTLFLMFIIIFIVSNSLFSTLIASIKELTIKINNLIGGNFTVDLKKLRNRKDEIGILAQDFEEMVEMLNNKIEELSKLSRDNIENSEKLELSNSELEKSQKRVEQKNSSIDMINKMLNSRISEISNLYYLIVNISKYMVDERFYKIVVKGIRDGLHIKKVALMENLDGVLKVKSALGINFEIEDVLMNRRIEELLKTNETIDVKSLGLKEYGAYLLKPYVIPLISERGEIYGILIIDNDQNLTENIKKSMTTYIKTIVLAYENRNLYTRLLSEIEKLENTTVKLQESEKIKNIFLSNISHELKIPLVPIKGYIEIILSGKIGNIEISQRKGLLRALSNTERLQDIIENILNYSRIEGGKYELVDTDFNLHRVANVAINYLEAVLYQKNIKIENGIKYNIRVNGDEDAFTRVFINLLSNAVKFSKENSKVFIRAVEEDGFYKVEIEDFGVGMDSGKIKSVFKGFRQLEEGDTRKFSGLGLGLTVANSILNYYGEGVSIKSRISYGTTVSFVIRKVDEYLIN